MTAAAIDITTEQRKALLALLCRFIPGVAVWAYGSRVKWTARPNSDLDLVVFTSHAQGPLVSELKDELAESSNIPFLVDLHVWDEIPERFRDIIREEYVVVQEAEEKQGRVAGEFSSTTIGALLAHDGGSVKTGPFGTILKAREYSTEGVPLISVGEVGYGSLRIHASTPRAPREVVDRLPEYVLQAGDIVFGRKGAVDRSALVKPEQAGWFLGSDGIRLRLPNSCDERFIAYQLQSSDTRTWLLQHATGTTMASLNQSTIERIPIVLPLLGEQRVIASVLGALDEKIESNRRTSRALERLARAIFRAWFVDFEPVKAKAGGARSFPDMSQEVFDSLPTRLVESELGPVPEGWNVGCIGDAVSVRGGGTPSTTVGEYWKNGTHCWLTPKDLSGMKDHILLTTARKITDKGVAKISSGLLPVGSVLLSSRAPVGYLVLSGVPTAINQGFIAMVCDGQLPPLYVFHWTQSVMDEIKNRASGTTFPEISKTAFRPIKVCVPTKPVLESFTAVVEPLFEKLAANIRESQSLERLRDYLLPKLLSGEVRVEEAKKSK